MAKRETLKSKRENKLYNKGLILHGNGKLLDYDSPETGLSVRYAQFNTRAVKDCPFRSRGCEAVCYATKGKHNCPDVKESRERSYIESRRGDFTESMIYTIETEKGSKRYHDSEMRVRIHESGDFYSVQYLRKWVRVWERFTGFNGVAFTLYTKSFPFFLMLTDEEKDIIRSAMKSGTLAINLSIDDTTDIEQIKAYLQMLIEFPLCNTYRCTENPSETEHDNICDCEDCAKCGTCNKATGQKTVVKIHSASKADMTEYRANKADGAI